MNSNYKVVVESRDMIGGVVLNSKMIICNVPDYSQMGSALVRLRISYGNDPLKT